MYKSSIFFALIFAPICSFAISKIDSFTVVRSGGGSHQIEIHRDPQGKISGVTKSCRFYLLSKEQQALTQFVLTGEDAKNAQAVFDGTAILTEIHWMKFPVAPTGTWRSMLVDVSYQGYDSQWKKTHLSIPQPLIVVDGLQTDLVDHIETLGKAAAGTICEEPKQ